MSREHGEKSSTAELDSRAVRGLLELETPELGPTVLIEREHLLALIDATVQPIVTASVNTIPRTVLQARERAETAESLPLSRDLDYERERDSVSLYVLFVLGMLITVFVAILQL